MRSNFWERLGAATGILFFITAAIALIGYEFSGPDIGASSGEIVSFVTDNLTTIQGAVLFLLLSSLFLMWFSGSIRDASAAVEPNGGRLTALAFAGGVLTALLLALAAILGSGLVVRDIAEMEEAAVQAIYVGSFLSEGLFFGASAVTRTVLLGAIGLASVRFGALPKWLGWITLILGAATGIGLLAFLGNPQESLLGFVAYLAFLAFFVWVLIASIVLVARPTPKQAAEAA